MARFRRNQMILSVIFILVVLYLILVFFPTFAPSFTKDSPTAVAKVDGEPIHLQELTQQYRMLPESKKQAITYEHLLNRTIEEKLMLKEAKREGITVTKEEVTASIDTLSQRISQEDLEKRLAKYNMTYDDLRDLRYRELMIEKLVNRTILSPIKVSEEDVRKRYENKYMNRTVYLLRHAMLDTRKEAKEVSSILEAGVPYQGIARKYPQEAEDIRNEGIIGYVTKGNPRYKGVKNLTINETKVFERDTKYEVIQLTEKQQDAPYRALRSHIYETLMKRRRSERLVTLLDDLRADAKIRVYKDRLP